ncbi:hypothetical protein GLYMA_02G227950v4 [Glycine max]|nr:hypothetical protein GLYMA_02G227950v4 [Glycine max]KAH1061654.1 hypothetical protein GYH30_004909 [Glycine max]
MSTIFHLVIKFHLTALRRLSSLDIVSLQCQVASSAVLLSIKHYNNHVNHETPMVQKPTKASLVHCSRVLGSVMKLKHTLFTNLLAALS